MDPQLQDIGVLKALFQPGNVSHGAIFRIHELFVDLYNMFEK
jgi:hypothetical protein